MSFFDSSYVDAQFTPTSKSHPAPTCMNHPAAGRFHLTNVILFEKHEGPARAREHQHRVYHLLIFCEGENEFLIGGRKTPSVRGTCVLSGPTDTHCFLPLNAGLTLYHAITFTFDPMTTPPAWAELLHFYTGRRLATVPPVFEIPETSFLNLAPLLTELRNALSLHTPSSSQRIHFGVLQMFAFIADVLDEQHRQRPIRPHASEIRAREYLDAHYANRLDLTEVARQIGITNAHLNRSFKRRYGIPPGRYRDTLRMDAASNLLQHSDLLVKEIAYHLGYPDLFTFSKAFRRHFNCPPSAFTSKGSA